MSEGLFDIDSLDELSREAANEHTLPFKEDAWTKMELLLDEDKKRRFVFWWWWLVPAILILIIGGIHFAIKNTDNNSTESKRNIANIKENKSFEPEIQTQQNELKLLKNSTTNIKKQKAEKQHTPMFDVAKHTILPINHPSIGNSNNRILFSSNKKGNTDISTNAKDENNGTSINLNPPASVTENSNPVGKNLITNYGPIKNPSIISNNTQVENNGGSLVQDKNNIVKANNNRSLLDTAVKKLDEYLITKNADSIQKAVIQNSMDTIVIIPKKANKSSATKLSKFEFSALVEADLSMVKFKKVEKISNGFGIGVSYNLGKRWAVGTGIFYTTKLYVADSTDYKKSVFNAWNLTVLNINANCKVIEIPVNIQYLLSIKKKSSWYATAGLSSYFMKKENYDYTILRNGMVKNMTYTYRNEYNHILSILTLQADYARKINNQFSFQLSPFIKLPLTGIGEGGVSLESVGLQFSLHYRPKKK